MSIYELYGRLMEERTAEHDAHCRTISLLRDVIEGRVDPCCVVFDSPSSYRVLPSMSIPDRNGRITEVTP